MNVDNKERDVFCRKSPIPSGLWQREGPSYEPVCEESKECIAGLSEFKGYGTH
jgi:hypothetical protein